MVLMKCIKLDDRNVIIHKKAKPFYTSLAAAAVAAAGFDKAI